jgi:hypothetical protein
MTVGFNATKLPQYFWNQLGLVKREFNDVSSMALLYVFVVVGSNLFSNVPLTILVLDQVCILQNNNDNNKLLSIYKFIPYNAIVLPCNV